jgi:hypothetical protein
MSNELVRIDFTWPDGAGAPAGLTGLAGVAYRAVDGDAGCLFVAADVATPPPPGRRLTRLVCTLRLPGAAAGTEAPFRYIVATDVEPAHEADFNAWYEQEHLPGLAAVPGVVQAMRCTDPAGSPRYHACYDLATIEAFNSPAWLAVRGTPWSSRVRPTFRNTQRTMYRRVAL